MHRSQAGREKVSRFGQYYGYSEAIYDGYQRRSQYLTLEDRTRLAYDLFTHDMFLWYANLTMPRRLIVRLLDHSEVEDNGADLEVGAEVHRWFDTWLKGIENGIMEEPPISLHDGRARGRALADGSPVGSFRPANDAPLLRRGERRHR